MAEKDVATTSIYKLTVDDRDMGKFKSSGLIISTGTGSSGWLYSARQITYHDVYTIQKFLGIDENTELASDNLSMLISSTNVFPYDSDKLYYYVREGYTMDPASFSWRAEGFCKTIKIISEMIDGSIQIDGYFKMDVGIGDTFYVRSNPEFSLKCIHMLDEEVS